MNLAGLIFLLVAHYMCGRGILQLFKIDVSPVAKICLSLIVGVAVLSFVPCVLQLLHIPINIWSVGFGIVVPTFLLCLPVLRQSKQEKIIIQWPKVYEWPFILFIAFVLCISVWRCFYYPPTSRDMLTGPELIAEYTVREHTMVNSVFTIDLHTTNNYFKSPYVTGLQIIYKLLVCTFGQLWLSVLVVSFVAWLYTILRSLVHPIIAGMLVLFFVAIPDLFGYTYLILYDYSNMVFFFGGYYFLTRYFADNRINNFIFSAFLFGLATYIRTETVVLVAMLLPLPAWHFYKQRLPFAKAIARLGLYLSVSVAFYVLCIDVFIRAFIPIPFGVMSQINPDIRHVSLLFTRFYDINTQLLFSDYTLPVYGWFIYFFMALVVADVIWPRKYNKDALTALYGVMIIYAGLAFLGYVLPLIDILNTTKRGFFKMFPIMLMYMGNSGIFLWLSAKIRQLTNNA